MKKLVCMFAVVVAAMFASCGNSTKNVESPDSTTVDTVEVDTLTADSL